MLESKLIESRIGGRLRRFIDRRIAFCKRDRLRKIVDEGQQFAESLDAAEVCRRIRSAAVSEHHLQVGGIRREFEIVLNIEQAATPAAGVNAFADGVAGFTRSFDTSKGCG